MPSLLNQYGHVITRRDKKAMGLYPSPYSYNNAGTFRQRLYSLQDTEQSINVSERRTQIALSRQLFAQMPCLSACSELKASLAVGNCYDPIYHGKDKFFWDAAEVWLKDWYSRCSTAGVAFNFRKCLKLISTKLDEDGDLLLTFVPTRSGGAVMQFVPAHRIDQRNLGDKVALEGKYKGYAVSHGVVKSSSGYPVGYYIQNNSEEDDYIASTRDAYLIFDPRHFDLQRGLPVIAAGLTTGLSLLDITEYLQTTIKVESMLNLIVMNDSGEAPPDVSTAEIEEDSVSGIPKIQMAPQVERMGQGLQYIKNSPGNKIESLHSNRPASETMNFIRKLETELVSLNGIPHQVLYSPDNVGGKTAYALSEIVRNTVSDRQNLLDAYARLSVSKALANAIDNGELPETQEPYYKLISFTHPEEFSLDRAYDSDIDQDNYRSGFTTLDEITSRRGKRGSEIRAQRKQEVIELYSTIAEIKKQFPQFSENMIHNDLGMLSANPLPDNPSSNNAPKE